MAASRAKTSLQSSPAGNYDDPFSDEDLCGYGCHADGVVAGASTAGCEHGTYAVTETTKRKAPAAARAVETVHDRSVHFPDEEPAPASTDALKEILSLANGHDARILKLEGDMRRLEGVVEQLVEHIASTGGEQPDPTGE